MGACDCAVFAVCVPLLASDGGGGRAGKLFLLETLAPVDLGSTGPLGTPLVLSHFHPQLAPPWVLHSTFTMRGQWPWE